jgi:hypothetical protein
MGRDFYDQMAEKWFKHPVDFNFKPVAKMNEAIERQQQMDIEQDEVKRNVINFKPVAKMNEAIERQQQMDIEQDEVKRTVINKKNAVGATKADTSCIPAVAIFALGAAMKDGAVKYDAYNYRESDVTASVFHNAMQRHAWDWWEGENYAPDSLVHHLGHLMACCAIVLDSISQGNFIDDRPKTHTSGASRRTDVWKQKH